MILSPTFGFPWPTSLGKAWFRPRCCLDNLPDDVLLDGVLHILTVKDILSVRMANKRFYTLTHHTSIWKRLLRSLNVPVPPLPPTSRRSFANLTGLEAERLFIRSLSLAKNFSSKSPTPYWGRGVEAFHHVQSMTILPGGTHLVASVKEETRNSFAIMIFVLDYRNGGALPLAKTDTPTQAYNLQAKYMKLHDQNGIVIAYTAKDIRSKKYKVAAHRYHSTTDLSLLSLTKASSIDISDLDPASTVDLPIPLKYQCFAVFCPLAPLEELGDPNLYFPGSKEFLEHARRQPSPFKLVAELSSASPLGPINLAEMFGSPCMAVVKGTRKIIFKNLGSPGYSMINCAPLSLPIEVPNSSIHFCHSLTELLAQNTAIKAIRLLPSEANIFVVQTDKIHGVIFSVFAIPTLDTVSDEELPILAVSLNRRDIDSIDITDNPPLFSAYPDFDLDPESPPNLIAHASRTISVLCSSAEDPVTRQRTLCRISFPSRPWAESSRPLPTVPFPLPKEIEDAPGGREAFIRKHTSHYCLMVPDRHLCPRAFAATDGKINCLPGSNHSLVYWNADSIRESSPLQGFAIYSAPPPSMTDDGGDPENEEVEAIINGIPMRRTKLGFKLVRMWENLSSTIASAPARCVAWDECIGRMCVALENDSRIFVVDFAQAPKEGTLSILVWGPTHHRTLTRRTRLFSCRRRRGTFAHSRQMVSEPNSVGLLRQAIEDLEVVMAANTFFLTAEVATISFRSLEHLIVLVLGIKLVTPFVKFQPAQPRARSCNSRLDAIKGCPTLSCYSCAFENTEGRNFYYMDG